jgi:hypothetical protein
MRSGYLRASGYFAIRPHLEKVPHIRMLSKEEAREDARPTYETSSNLNGRFRHRLIWND